MKAGLCSLTVLRISIQAVLCVTACEQAPVTAEGPALSSARSSSAPIVSSAPAASNSAVSVSSAPVSASVGLAPSSAAISASSQRPSKKAAHRDPDYCKGQLREGCTDPKSGFVARD